MPDFEIAGIKVPPGTRSSTWIDVGRSPGGGALRVPLVVVNGGNPGPTLLVDAATHGDEAEGPLAIVRLLSDIAPERLAGCLLAVPVLHVPAFDGALRGNPLEIHNYDLNRAFPGVADGSITQRIAAAYFEGVVRRADAVISLHGGGNVFYLDGFVIAPPTSDGLTLVRAMGWKRFTASPDSSSAPHTGTLVDACAHVGIPALTVEMGGASHRSPDLLNRTVGEFLRGIRNVMIHLEMLVEAPVLPDELWRIRKQNLRASTGGILDVVQGLDIGVDVEEGAAIASVYGPQGDLLEEHRAPFRGTIIGLPASPVCYPGRIIGSVYEVVEVLPLADE